MLAGLVETIVEWIRPAFSVAGYPIIAAAVLAERSIFIGLLIPGDVILALGGVYASQGRMSLVLVIVIGTISAIIGESIGYWLGRRHGVNLLRHLPLLNRLEKRLHAAQDYFKKHGGKTVAIGRYATAAGAFVPFTAGMGKMPFRRFLLFDVPAIVVWASAITIFGYEAGQHLDFIDTVLSRFGFGVLALVAAFFLGRYLWRRFGRGRRASDAS